MVRDTTPTSYMFDIDRTHLPEKVRGTNLRDIKSVCGGGGTSPAWSTPLQIHHEYGNIFKWIRAEYER